MPKSPEARPTISQWRQAYKLARAVSRLAPWKWMKDSDNFGFRDPVTGRDFFITVMGNRGEYYAIGVFLSAEELLTAWEVFESPCRTDEERIQLVSMPQLEFGSRIEVTPSERSVLKQLGLRFRGENGWPLFRMHAPSHVSGPVNAEQLRVICLALEQVLAIAPLYRDTGQEFESLRVQARTEKIILVRMPVLQDGKVKEWKIKPVDLNPIEDARLQKAAPALNKFALQKARRLPQRDIQLEVAFRLMLNLVKAEDGASRILPWLFLLIEAEIPEVIAATVIPPDSENPDLFEKAPQALLDALLSYESRPTSITLCSPILHRMLTPLCDKLDIDLNRTDGPLLVENMVEMLDQYLENVPPHLRSPESFRGR